MTYVLATVAACAPVVRNGTISDASGPSPTITSVDTAVPPQFAWVQLPQPGYAVLLLVTPSHSAVLLYPADSSTSNRLVAGAHQLDFAVPVTLVETDSARRRRMRELDSTGVRGVRDPRDPRDARDPRDSRRTMPTTMGTAPPRYLLLLTSAQPLDYGRIIAKTAGVTIPSVQNEAINAVAKAVKSTLPTEPREVSGYFTQVRIRRE